MANEIEMSARLYAAKDGASINPQVYTAIVNMTGRDMGQQTQDVGTTQEALDLTADLATPYKVLLYNMDLQNSFKIGTAFPFEFEVPPREFILLPRVNATLYVQANNSTVKIFAQFCEI